MKENENEIVPEIDAFTIFIKKITSYIQDHKNVVMAGCAGFLVALVIISLTPSWIAKKNAAAFTELSRSIDRLYKADSLTAERIDEVFNPVNQDYSGSKAWAFGKVYAARSLYEIGDKEKAAKYLEEAAKSFDKGDVVWNLAEYELGCIYFDTDSEKALNYFEKIASEDSVFKEDALFYLGMLGQKESLKKLMDTYPDGFYSVLAKEKYLAMK